MCKVGQNWNVGLKPQQMCHTPSQMDIYWSMLEDIFIITHQIFSLCIWFFRSSLGVSSSPHVGKLQQRYFCFDQGFQRRFDQCWLLSMLGQTDPNLSQNSDFYDPHFLAWKSRMDVDFDWVALTFCCYYFALTIDWDNVDFRWPWVD